VKIAAARSRRFRGAELAALPLGHSLPAAQPKLRGRTEESAEPKRRVSGNRATSAADLRDPCDGNTDALRKLVLGIAILPPKADPPLFIDTNAVLPGPVATQRLEPIVRRHAQV